MAGLPLNNNTFYLENKMKKLTLLAALAIASVGSAYADSISFSSSYGPALTNWNQNLSLNQFDSSLGSLTSIVFDYNGNVSSTFRFESLDAAPATLTANASADIVFGLPISDTLSISGSAIQPVTAFDGSIDFGGTSGALVGPVTGSDSGSLTLLSAFAPYIGLGTYNINVAATGLSNVSGAGNLISQISTQAFAEIKVTYN